MVPKLLKNHSSEHMIHKMECLIDNPMGPKVSESRKFFIVSCCKVYSLQQEITSWMMVHVVIKQQRHHVFPPMLHSSCNCRICTLLLVHHNGFVQEGLPKNGTLALVFHFVPHHLRHSRGVHSV